MSMELILALSGVGLSLLGGLAHFVSKTHLQKCTMCCIDSDCRQGKNKSVPGTPISKEPQMTEYTPTIEDNIQTLFQMVKKMNKHKLIVLPEEEEEEEPEEEHEI